MAEPLAGRLASPGIEQAPVPAKLVLRSPEPSEHVRPGEIENVLKRPTDRDVYIRRQDPLGLGLSCLRVGGDIRRAKQAGIVEAAARPTRPLTCQDVKRRASLERQGNVAVQDVSVEGALPRRQRHGLEDRTKSPVVEHYPGSPATTLRM